MGWEVECYACELDQQSNKMRKYKSDMIMKMKFRIKKYSHVLNGISTGYNE
jgi:hypothetical protein